MNTLKRSKFVKVLCFTLSFLCCVLAYANVFLFIVVQDENLYNVDRSVFEEKIYEKAADYTAREATWYYHLKLLSDAGQYDYSGFSDLKTYASSFSEERSNAAFVIKTREGKELFRNYDMGENFAYAFDFNRDIEIEKGISPDAVPMETTAQATEVTGPEPTEQTTTEVDRAQSEEPTTSEEPTAAARAEEETTSQPLYGVYIEDDRQNGEDYAFKYIYPAANGHWDERILAFCKELFYSREYKESNSPWYGTEDFYYIVYFEENYSISVNGQVYFNENPTHDYIKLATAASPEDYTTTYEEYNDGYDYRDYFDVIPCTVTVYVAKDINRDAKDIYKYIDMVIGAGYDYVDKLVPLTVIFAIAGIALFILLLCLCGYSKGYETAVAKKLHRFPFDLLLLLYISIGGVAFAIAEEIGALGTVIFVLPICFMLLLPFLEGLAVRIKAKDFTFGLVYLFRFLAKGGRKAGGAVKRFGGKAGGAVKRFGRKLSDSMNVLWKMGLAFLLLAVFTFFIALLWDEAAVIVWIIGMILLFAATVLAAVNFHTLQEGAKKISEGKLGYRIENKFLFGEFRKNAEYLNNINAAVDNAVKEQMQSERMKTELITNVSHDLKTPLTSIVNYVDLLKKEEISNEKAKEYIEVIDRQSQRLKKLTTDVVDASKAATGNIPIHFEKTALGMLISQMNGEYADKLEASKLQAVVSVPENEVFISADGRLLWRVFDNLMNNICKYSLPGTRVYVSLESADGKAKVTFRNISGAELNVSPAELTERFVRGDASRNTEGSGLGLSIANSLVSSMRGTMNIGIDGDLFKVTLTFPEIN